MSTLSLKGTFCARATDIKQRTEANLNIYKAPIIEYLAVLHILLKLFTINVRAERRSVTKSRFNAMDVLNSTGVLDKQDIVGNPGKCAYSIRFLKFLSLSPNSSNNDALGSQDGFGRTIQSVSF